MELKEFVSAVLTEIIDGVSDAQRDTDAKDGEINPLLSTSQGALQSLGYKVSRWGQLVQSVKFDVAVTAEEGKDNKGGVGVFLGSVGLGTQREEKTSSASISRIQFEVPISLPYKEKKQ